LEINSFPQRLDLNDIHSRMAKDIGAMLVINTDAHIVPQLDLIRFGVATARRGWIGRGDVLNTLSCKKLLKALRP
jgi:DNA polymerase (family 10)